MPVWSCDCANRLIRVDLNDSTMAAPEPSTPVLMDLCYPQRTSHPSCIKLPAATGDNYELRPQFISILPKFHRLESADAYMFITEFEEVCALFKIQHLSEDAIKLRFIPFALKGTAKKWLYSLTTSSITTWEAFVTLFLKKFFPRHKTARIRNEINQFQQLSSELFWKYLE